MDTNEMLRIVNLLGSLKPFFRGIYASDSLPIRVTEFPSALVCNTDPVKEKGSHWIAFWFKNGTECEFYDSFGKLPEDYDIQLRSFIDRNSFACVYNDVQVQSNSASTCGFHVLFYLYRRAQGFSMQSSLRMLNGNNSDDIVRHFILKKITKRE
jgi:hypothetical protein